MNAEQHDLMDLNMQVLAYEDCGQRYFHVPDTNKVFRYDPKLLDCGEDDCFDWMKVYSACAKTLSPEEKQALEEKYRF